MTSLTLQNINTINKNTLEYNYKIKNYSIKNNDMFNGVPINYIKKDYNFTGKYFSINYRELINNLILDIIFSEEFQILCIHEDENNNTIFTADLQISFYSGGNNSKSLISSVGVQIPTNKTNWLSIGKYAEHILDDDYDEFYDASYDTNKVYFEDILRNLISESELWELGYNTSELNKNNSYEEIGEAINKKYSALLSNIDWNKVKIILTNKFAPVE